MSKISIFDSAQRTIDRELQAVQSLKQRIGEEFEAACQLMLHCSGRVVVTGMGKSGHIANKIAATLASTGTPSFFVHPGEASHGDMGMITREDVVIALSNSGSTAELLTIVPLIKRLGAKLISMTGDPSSVLAQLADINLDISIQTEACPLGLAPTSSTTASLVMGDALAIALLETRGFTAEDFAYSHPGGALGRKLLLKVADIMHVDREIPRVNERAFFRDALLEMTAKGLGMTTVLDSDQRLIGVFTDGDLRRTMDAQHDIHNTKIRDIMTPHPSTITPDILAAEALRVMEQGKITSLIVVDQQHCPTGVLHLHDILRAGVA